MIAFWAWSRFSASWNTTEFCRIDHLIRHLFASVGGETVHEQGIGFRRG